MLSFVLKLHHQYLQTTEQLHIRNKQRCSDGVINDFLSRFRHYVVPLLFHEVTSLHPLSFQRNDFSTCIYTSLEWLCTTVSRDSEDRKEMMSLVHCQIVCCTLTSTITPRRSIPISSMLANTPPPSLWLCYHCGQLVLS